MKVSIGSKIQNGPWGGGNLFAINFSRFLKKNGHEVVFDLNDNNIDIILLTEPRKSSPSSAFTNYDVLNYLKYKNSSAIVVHRVNECDEHKGTKFINKYITYANLCADATIFVSSWIKNLYIQQGNFASKPHEVILAGSDKLIFNRNKFNLWDGLGKIKITTHHWSTNWNKGFEVYKNLDSLLNKKQFKDLFEFTFIGRLPENLELNNSKIVSPLTGIELARELKSNHLYITGSLYEPSGNHHIEASQCGLPVLYIDSGGIKEYCGDYGIEFNSENLEEKVLYVINNYKELVEKTSNYPGDSDKMSQEFLTFFESLLLDKKFLFKKRIKQKPTYLKDILFKFKR